jgi:spore maturation protein SpmB
MKRSDVAAVILIASISIAAAYFVANSLIGTPTSESVKVKTASPISSDISEPDKDIFNKDAINPTVEVVIGDE